MSDYAKAIVATLQRANKGGRMMPDLFADFCRSFALSLESPFTTGAVHDGIEAEYAAIMERNRECRHAFAECAATTIMALEERREEFLGRVHEAIGASNIRNGQFFTPAAVARAMSEICMDEVDYKPGTPITINDPACGACVTMIANAETLLGRGVPQRDILIDAGDIDIRALDMGYIELSLLGYAAVVRHQNALSQEVLSRPRLSTGYFVHEFPMRGWRDGRRYA